MYKNTKRGKLKTGPRKNILNVRYASKIIKELGLEDSGLSPLDVINIIKESNSEIKSLIIDNVEGYKLSHNLGYIIMNAVEFEKKKIDYKRTKELGVKVYHLNPHGQNANPQWENYNICKNKLIHNYSFVPNKKFNKEKTQSLKKGKIYSSVPKNYFYYLTYKMNK